MTRAARVALVSNAILVGLGSYGWIGARFFGIQADYEWTRVLPIVVGSGHLLAICCDGGHRRLHGLTHLWALFVLFLMPFCLVSATEFSSGPGDGWTDPSPPTWFEYLAIGWVFGATIAALVALRFARFFRPPLWLSSIVIPVLGLLLATVASRGFESWVHELLYGPRPADYHAWSWAIDHPHLAGLAQGWFLLIWCLYFIIGAYCGIPRHSALADSARHA
jgi:hypothetical protein